MLDPLETCNYMPGDHLIVVWVLLVAEFWPTLWWVLLFADRQLPSHSPSSILGPPAFFLMVKSTRAMPVYAWGQFNCFVSLLVAEFWPPPCWVLFFLDQCSLFLTLPFKPWPPSILLEGQICKSHASRRQGIIWLNVSTSWLLSFGPPHDDLYYFLTGTSLSPYLFNTGPPAFFLMAKSTRATPVDDQVPFDCCVSPSCCWVLVSPMLSITFCWPTASFSSYLFKPWPLSLQEPCQFTPGDRLIECEYSMVTEFWPLLC